MSANHTFCTPDDNTITLPEGLIIVTEWVITVCALGLLATIGFMVYKYKDQIVANK